MELTPRDLGTERYLSVVRKRLGPTVTTVHGTTIQSEMPLPPQRERRRGSRLRARMHRHWTRDLNLDAESSEEVASLISRGPSGVGMKVGVILSTVYLWLGAFITLIAQAPPFFPFLFLSVWALIMFALFNSPRATLKTVHNRALTVPEVEALLPNARGRLERMYLNLVLDALRLDVPSESARSDIQVALRSLGDAISRLPADPVSTQDPAVLRKEVVELRNQAAVEHDAFVRASLNRQADALERRAAMAAQNSRSARRSAALRREARIQMDNLRSVLVAYSHHTSAGVTHAGEIADAVHRVSTEAQALSLAQGELEEEEIAELFREMAPATQPSVTPQTVAPSPVIQQVATQPSAQTPPQPTVVSSRQWWRNG